MTSLGPPFAIDQSQDVYEEILDRFTRYIILEEEGFMRVRNHTNHDLSKMERANDEASHRFYANPSRYPVHPPYMMDINGPVIADEATVRKFFRLADATCFNASRPGDNDCIGWYIVSFCAHAAAAFIMCALIADHRKEGEFAKESMKRINAGTMDLTRRLCPKTVDIPDSPVLSTVPTWGRSLALDEKQFIYKQRDDGQLIRCNILNYINSTRDGGRFEIEETSQSGHVRSRTVNEEQMRDLEALKELEDGKAY